MLDLRGDASAPEPDVTEPPGLDRVRRWLAPLRRFFRGVWLWVRYLWRGTLAFSKNAAPGTLLFLRSAYHAAVRFGRAIGRYAVRGKRRARATARFLRAVARSGARLQATGRNWSRAEGRLGRLGGGMARAGRWVRVGAEGSAELVLGIGDLAGELGELAPEGPEREADAALGRLLPRGPARPEASRGNGSPDRPRASLDTGPADTTPAKRDVAHPVSGRGEAAARTPSPGDQAAVDPPPEKAAPAARTPSVGDQAAVDPPPEKGAPAARTPSAGDQAAVDSPPEKGEAAARTPSAGDQAAVDSPPEKGAPAALPPAVRPATSPSGGGGRRQLRPNPPEDLRFDLYDQILGLGERPPQERTRVLILGVCAARDWVQPAELAHWFGVGASNLTKRHLGPLTKAGLLERRYPEAPRHRLQAYRTTAAGKAAGGWP